MKAAAAVEKLPAPAQDRPRIMVVEDDDVYRQLVKRWLSEDFDVITLPHGESLMDDMLALEPDLVLLDMGLPERSGASLCRDLRRDARFKSTPVVFITGMPDDEHFMTHMTSGGYALLSKMSPPDLIRTTLWDVLREAGA